LRHLAPLALAPAPTVDLEAALRARHSAPAGSLLERFQITRLIGEGNFGTVYETRDLWDRAERLCALKILHRKQYRLEGMMDRARLERQVLKAARHPFIVRLFCAFRTPARELALVMEYCPNGDLNNLVVRCGRPGLQETLARRILAEVLLALQYLHEELDVVFRDLKPENIVLDAAMHAKLTDFGLVKVNVTADEGARSFVGSTYYVAPEVSSDGCAPYGPAVDLYALGLVSWVCFTGGNRVVATPEDTPVGRGTCGPVERAEPPESHQSLRRWLRTQRSAEAESSGAHGGAPRAHGMSSAALSWVDTLTARNPDERGTARTLRVHPFFTLPGRDPPLASSDDWAALLPQVEEPATPSSTGSADSWSWDPPRRS